MFRLLRWLLRLMTLHIMLGGRQELYLTAAPRWQVHRTPMIGMVPPDLSQPQTAFPSYYQPEVTARPVFTDLCHADMFGVSSVRHLLFPRLLPAAWSGREDPLRHPRPRAKDAPFCFDHPQHDGAEVILSGQPSGQC